MSEEAELPMDRRLELTGCGRHAFATEPPLRLQPEKYPDSPTYVCTNRGCKTRVYPGQLLYDAAASWFGRTFGRGGER